ncbi:MAG: pyridoxamine 5'-phosphate oxidase family protein [Dehalococcoidia bacterium]|nr:MAG: pyridoxamine 5'-phosphate oxidase family protein [Dehalococcoidia bacterium]
MSSLLESKDLLRQVVMIQRFAVLATQQKERPYINLITFAASDDLAYILFATSRNTQKYRNILANRKVALLIDSRDNKPSDFSKAVAITALGLASEVTEDEKDKLVEHYLNRHPTLTKFIHRPETALIRVKVNEYILARFERVERIQVNEKS